LHEQDAEMLVKIFVRSCEILEGDIGVQFVHKEDRWKRGKASRDEILKAAVACQQKY